MQRFRMVLETAVRAGATKRGVLEYKNQDISPDPGNVKHSGKVMINAVHFSCYQ